MDEDPAGVSSALFNNAAFAEVVGAAHQILESREAEGLVTTRKVAARTGRGDSVVRPVMLRLAAANLLKPKPKTGASNSTQYYSRLNMASWESLIELLATLGDSSKSQRDESEA